MLAAGLPTTAQFDIVFPQNHTVYTPVTEPFPFVFALHNGSVAMRYETYWHWELRGFVGATNQSFIYVSGSSNRYDSPLMDETLIIQPIYELRNATAKNLQLSFTFGIRDTCYGTAYVPANRELDVHLTDWVTFSFDRDNSVVPNLIAAGPCATPVGSVLIESESKEMYGGQTCAVLKSAVQPPQTCALLVDEAVASRVEERLLNETKCDGSVWPYMIGVGISCDRKSSGDSLTCRGHDKVVAAGGLLAILFAIQSMLW